ncbi:hypothetical protein [Streptomyces viridochromogenes]|nr:hypothetical protein [Streptomyces viridochromogenes]
MEIALAAAPAANRSRIDTPATAWGRCWTLFSDADMDASWGRGRT